MRSGSASGGLGQHRVDAGLILTRDEANVPETCGQELERIEFTGIHLCSRRISESMCVPPSELGRTADCLRFHIVRPRRWRALRAPHVDPAAARH
jgi:hypothetical protein